MKQARKIKVDFLGGESRYGSHGVDFMLAVIPDEYLTPEQIEAMEADDMRYPYPHNGDLQLYAEVDPRDYGAEQEDYENGGEAPAEVDAATYEALKAEILAQAEKYGIPAEMLEI